MRYIQCKGQGGPEVLQLREGSIPTPAAGEVLIKVAAAGINRPDLFQCQGLYPPPADASPILGLEVAGEIVGLGEGSEASGWQPGDSVCALTNGGGYADYVVAPASQCLPVPAGLSMVEAAALPEACFTVWSNVFDRCGLQMGESFLVHGGSSGIGTTAIQMAVALGARVFASAGSDEKCRACESLGAELAINYRQQDFVEPLMAATAAKGVDVILDMVGGDYIQRNLKLAARDGRIANIAFLRGAKAELNLLPVMVKRLTLTGSTLRPQSLAAKATIAQQLRDTVWPLISTGKIKPLIAAEFSLEQVQDAHRLMLSSEHVGKIVLRMT